MKIISRLDLILFLLGVKNVTVTPRENDMTTMTLKLSWKMFVGNIRAFVIILFWLSDIFVK